MSARLLPSLLLAAFTSPAQARDRVLRLPAADALADPPVRGMVGALPLRFGAATGVNAELAARDVQIDGTAEPLRENQNQRDSVAPSDEGVRRLRTPGQALLALRRRRPRDMDADERLRIGSVAQPTSPHALQDEHQ